MRSRTLLSQLRSAFILSILALLVLGIAYPLAGAGLSQLLFPSQAGGSLTTYGSTLVGQPWTGPEWFHGRADPYNPLRLNGAPGTSGGSNLGPRSKSLVRAAGATGRGLLGLGVRPTEDLVTSSGSGIDPDISPRDALAQVPMVSRATGIPARRLRLLIRSQETGAEMGFLGPTYVDVLQLNLALSRLR